MEQWKLPEDWEWMKVKNITETVKTVDPAKIGRDSFIYIEISSIDSSRGAVDISQLSPIPVNSAPSRARKPIKKDDVIFATTRHYLKNIALIPEELDDQICSTGFCVLRAQKQLVLPKYIYFAVRSDFFIEQLTPKQRGANYPAVADSDVFDSEIPIPYPNDPARSLETQKRIVLRLETLLGEVKSARELQGKIEEDTEQLLSAFFAETFSDANGWEVHPISEFADVKGGKRLPKGEKFAEGQTEYPYLRVVDFKDFSIYKDSLKYLTPEIQQRIRHYTISKDDIYISIAGTIGLVGTIPPELDGSNLTENAAKIVFRPEYKEKIDPKFVAYYLASPHGKEQIKKYTMAAGQPKLALIRIQTIEVPLPDINIQKSIVNRIDSIREEITEMQRAQYENAELLEQTEQSLLAQAFRGEL